jgi:DNA-directed RNA polymerase specialized sigma24 family protein
LVEPSNIDGNRLTDALVRVLEPQLKQYLRSRYRLVADHEDVVQETLADLHHLLVNRGNERLSIDSLTGLAFVILKRRVADRYRGGAKDFALAALAPSREEPLAPSSETVASYRELLLTVLGFIATMDPSDRSLLLDQAIGIERTAMPPAERKRLSRLRAQLRDQLERRGVSPQDFKEDSGG